ASSYARSVSSSGLPKYVPIPMDETDNPSIGRKCPGSCGNRFAYAAVASAVARLLSIMLSLPRAAARLVAGHRPNRIRRRRGRRAPIDEIHILKRAALHKVAAD